MGEDVVQSALEPGGALDEINEVYSSRGWTDGLPIIPPTEGRVRAMMAAVGRDPEAVVATIPPKWGQATIRKLAVNAVNVNDHVSTTAPNLLHTMAHSMAIICMNHSYCRGMCDVFVVFGPEYAETMAREDWT